MQIMHYYGYASLKISVGHFNVAPGKHSLTHTVPTHTLSSDGAVHTPIAVGPGRAISREGLPSGPLQLGDT